MNLFALMSDVGWTLWGAIQAKISAVDYDFRGHYTCRRERALAAAPGPAEALDGCLGPKRSIDAAPVWC